MKKNYSDFQIQGFMVLSSHIEAVPVPPDKIEKFKSLEDLEIDVKFEIMQKQDDDKEYKIMSTVSANTEERIPGYLFNIVTQANFRFSRKTKKEKKDKMLLFSGLPMLINSVRAYLMSVTSFGPYGKYTLPMLDVKKIIEENQQEGADE